MRLRFQNSPLPHAALWLFVLLSLSFLSACGAKQQRSELAHGLPAIERGDIAVPHLRVSADGRLVVHAIDSALKKANFFTLHPHQWNDELGEAPVLGTGYLVHAGKNSFAVLVSYVPNSSFEGMPIQAADNLHALTSHKGLTTVGSLVMEDETDSTPSQVQLDIGASSGVTRGDWYYVLTETRLNARQPRLGDLIGALVRVESVENDLATAEVIHAVGTIKEGQHAVFAQKTALMAPSPIAIQSAPLSPNATSTNGLPPMMQALPQLAAEYQISHTTVEQLSQYIDPRPWDASYNAEDAAPDDGWGIVVFGAIDEHTLIYNSVGYGNVPSPSGWVGILPGGLPLPFKSSVEELAPQLAVSYLSNGLGMRGDHAHAVYVLEAELRTKDFDPRMRYHLREHLALRYAALGHVDESMRLMHYDLLNAERQNDIYSQLNARSIRIFLDREWTLYEQAILDANIFLELADGTLPDYALEGERLNLARALIDTEQLDDAEELITAVAARTEARGDYRAHLYAITLLARAQIQRGQLETAVLVLDALRKDMESYPKETQVSIRLLAAELFVQMENYNDALEILFDSFDDFEAISPSGRAAMLQRAASIMMSVDQPIQATRAILDAAGIYEGLGLEPDAAEMWWVGANLRLKLVQELPPSQAINMLIDARGEFQRATELYLGLGNNNKAAEALLYVAILQSRLNGTGAKEPLFDQVEAMLLALGQIVDLAQVSIIRQQMAEAFNDSASAKYYREKARRLLELSGVEDNDDAAGDVGEQEIPLTSDEEP